MAKKSPYLPASDQEKILWLNNFAFKFSNCANTLGMTADVAAVTDDAAMFAYIMQRTETFTTTKQQHIDLKNLLRSGPLGTAPVPVQDAPVVDAPPNLVPAGIFPRIAMLVQRIKNNAAYTEAIGKDLGIIGAEMIMKDDAIMKPILKLVLKGGQVEIQWTKGNADGVHIESDKGTGWQFLAIDTVPHYTDTTPITVAANWKYRAMYIVNDEKVGQWSDTSNITVG